MRPSVGDGIVVLRPGGVGIVVLGGGFYFGLIIFYFFIGLD